jgi:uncharacterized protein
VGAQKETLRVVLDTNVVVSALVFGHGTMPWFRRAWQSVRFVPLADQHAIQEVIRVLGYPKFGLNHEDVRQLLGDYLPYAEVVTPSGRLPRLPTCRDPDDQPFLILAQAGKADVLVSGDRALLDLAGKTAFRIEAPAAFRRRFG